MLFAGLLAAGCAALRPGFLQAPATASATAPGAPQRTEVAPLTVIAPTATCTATEAPTSTPTANLSPTATATMTPTPPPTLTPTPTLPAPTPDGQLRTACVPILMYHYVSEPPADADAIRRDLSVSPREFDAQLAYLQAEGYTSISLEDLVRNLTIGRPLPPKPIVFTFDDGYADNYDNALPLLEQHGFRGTFFVITGLLDERRGGYLTWEQAAEMQARGMEIEAHSAWHPDLRILGDEQLQAEALGARQAIEAHLQQPVRFFCYPSGRYDGRTLAALRSAQYWAAVTTEAGALHASNGLLALSRIRIHGGNDLEQLKALLRYYTE